MLISHLKCLLFCCCVSLLCVLAGCNTNANTTASSNTPVSTPTQPQVPPQATSTSSAVSHGAGPIVILSPTPVPGGNSSSQMIVLPDRTLIINNVSKQSGSDANSTAIVLIITIKNTGEKSIMNEASFFQLIGTEGDTFGLASNITSNFFGAIASKASRNGTLSFQVPTAAINGIRLLYRSEIANETVFISLKV